VGMAHIFGFAGSNWPFFRLRHLRIFAAVVLGKGALSHGEETAFALDQIDPSYRDVDVVDA
jgi:hypothetical protein